MADATTALLNSVLAQPQTAPQAAPQQPYYPAGDSRNGPAAVSVSPEPQRAPAPGMPQQTDPTAALLQGVIESPDAHYKPAPPAAPPAPHQLPQWAKDMGVSDPWFGGDGHAGAAGALTNGMMAGYGDEAAGFMAATEHNAVPFLTGQPTNWNQDYADVRDSYRDAEKNFAGQHPNLNAAAPVMGLPFMGEAGVARSIAEAPSFWNRVATSAMTGGEYGGIAGFGSGEGGFENRLEGAGKGAATGAAVGAAFVPAASAITGTAATLGRLLSRGAPVLNRDAGQILTSSAADDGVSIPDAIDRIGNDPTGQLTLADIGGDNSKLLRLGRALVTAKTPASQEITSTLNARNADQYGRFSDAIQSNLSGDTDTYGNLSALIKARSTAAKPLYEAAFESDSLAPFEDQLRAHLQTATSAKGLIARQIKQIEQNNPGALAARGAAGAGTRSNYMDLQQQLQQAEANRQSVQDLFQQAKQDGTANAPGAVWSPRVQQFLNDPIMQHGINEGLEIQRLEALAEDKPFNPTDYAVVGKDEKGQSIVGAVPNMRLLNTAKIGLDKIIEQYRDPTTLRLNLDQRGKAIDSVRRAFLGELDSLNPAYKSARQAWAGPSAAMDAVESGQRFLNMDPEQIGTVQEPMSDGERHFFKVGAGRALMDKISDASDNADLTKRVFGNPTIRSQIEAAFGPEAAGKMGNAMASEKAMFNTGQFVTGGSQTANKLADFDAPGVMRRVLGDALQGGTAGFMGGGLHGAAVGAVGLPVTKALGNLASSISERSAMNNPETAATLGKLLMARGPEGADYLRSTITPFAERAAKSQAQRTKILGAMLRAQPAAAITAGEQN